MCTNILAHGIDLTFLELEPFSKREALNWLMSKANESPAHNQIRISIRHLAGIWRWHKSKVARFIKTLREKTIIGTVIDEGKTSITLCNITSLIDSLTKADTHGETVVGTATCFDMEKAQKRDTCDTADISPQAQETSTIQAACLNHADTNAIQNRDAIASKKKRTKEKNQKKKREKEFLKEKNIPYGDIKKEKKNPTIHFSAVKAADVMEFATNIGIDACRLELELGKFKDYLEAGYKKLPKNAIAAFRNWLRKSIEFNGFRGRNEHYRKTKSTSFERFLAGTARAIAERSGLDREHVWDSSTYADHTPEFSTLQPAN